MSEYEIQCSIVKYFRENYKDSVIFSVPNEASWQRSNKFIASGMLKGAADLVVVMKGMVIFIELKTRYNKQSPEQIQFQESIENLGYQYYVVRSLDEFIYVIKHAYGPYGPDMRPLDYKDWKTNLEDSLPKDKPAKKLARKVSKQGIEAGVG